ncbi:hypothetical protein Ancab_035038 [Ancistrocladus abbreviatus]
MDLWFRPCRLERDLSRASWSGVCVLRPTKKVTYDALMGFYVAGEGWSHSPQFNMEKG